MKSAVLVLILGCNEQVDVILWFESSHTILLMKKTNKCATFSENLVLENVFIVVKQQS